MGYSDNSKLVAVIGMLKSLSGSPAGLCSSYCRLSETGSSFAVYLRYLLLHLYKESRTMMLVVIWEPT